MARLLQRFGLWLAGWGGWTPCIHEGYVPEASMLALQTEVVEATQAAAAATATWADLQHQYDVATAVADQVSRRYADLLASHGQLTNQVTALVAQRDAARDDFAAYAQQQLGVRADVVVRARYLVSTWHKRGAHQDGEHKRHQVYADLIKEFPTVPKRDLSLAIEMGLRAIDA